jgi:hypothetical protein
MIAMNTSNLCQFAFILQTSSSALESPARKALENKAQSDFFWLLVATAFVAIGIAFEYPEVKHEFIEWLRSRKKPWLIEPVPMSRNRVPLWSLVGFIIVTAGVAGEGVYEGLLGINDTKLRKMDEVSLAADELQITQLQKDNLTLQKQAGDAATSAHNAAADAGKAKTLAQGARTEADSFDKRIVSANATATAAEQHLAEARREAAQAEAELDKIRSPRSLTNQVALIAALAAFKGTGYSVRVYQDDESIEFTRTVDRVLVQAGWIRQQPTAFREGITVNVFGSNIADAVPLCIETGIQIQVHTEESLEVLQSTPFAKLPRPVQAAEVLRDGLVPSVSPSDERNVGNSVRVSKIPSVTPVLICVGKKP